MAKRRRRYGNAGPQHKRKLLDQAQEVLGYHRKAAIRDLRRAVVVRGSWFRTGRTVEYESRLLDPWLRPIWKAPDYACGRQLVAMLPEWLPAYKQHERAVPEAVREATAAGQRADHGPAAGAVAPTREGPVADTARHVAAPPDPRA